MIFETLCLRARRLNAGDVDALLRVYGDADTMRRVIAAVAPGLAASQRVLLKTGMHRGDLRANGDGAQTEMFERRAKD